MKGEKKMEMDVMQAVTAMIGSVGFPIVMCLMMYKYMTEVQKKTDETLASLTNAISALEKGVDTLVNFTIAKDNA